MEFPIMLISLKFSFNDERILFKGHYCRMQVYKQKESKVFLSFIFTPP